MSEFSGEATLHSDDVSWPFSNVAQSVSASVASHYLCDMPILATSLTKLVAMSG